MAVQMSLEQVTLTAWWHNLSVTEKKQMPLDLIVPYLSNLACMYANSRLKRPAVGVVCAAALYHAFQHDRLPKCLNYLGTQKELAYQFNTSVFKVAQHWANLEAWIGRG